MQFNHIGYIYNFNYKDSIVWKNENILAEGVFCGHGKMGQQTEITYLKIKSLQVSFGCF